MNERHICFSHGKESGPWGTKIRALAGVARAGGWTVESLDYQGIDDPLERVAKLRSYAHSYGRPMALAGSSMGGFVAAAVAAELSVAGLFLMAPAFYVPGYEQYVPPPASCPTTIVHGWRDDVVPWEDSVRYASRQRAQLVLIDGDHRLTDNLAEVGAIFGRFLGRL
ncbi:MAG: alpha/beta hydrolase [Gammaproteobacteria bacterium]|nr:alpha/beta hydrolase [Gammaproteobacteria bacterium]